ACRSALASRRGQSHDLRAGGSQLQIGPLLGGCLERRSRGDRGQMKERSPRGLRGYLTYANVMATITAFAVLAGGTAIAANQLAKNSVGKKQLKANAVTTKKIKKNAVTAAKIKAGAVDGSKVKDASLGVGTLNLADMPFSRIVHKARGSSSVAISEAP